MHKTAALEKLTGTQARCRKKHDWKKCVCECVCVLDARLKKILRGGNMCRKGERKGNKEGERLKAEEGKRVYESRLRRGNVMVVNVNDTCLLDVQNARPLWRSFINFLWILLQSLLGLCLCRVIHDYHQILNQYVDGPPHTALHVEGCLFSLCSTIRFLW